MEEKQEQKIQVPEVRIEPGGPIVLKGYFTFRDSSGNIVTGEQEIYLCRCGGSKNMPFCDDTHKKIGVPG